MRTKLSIAILAVFIVGAGIIFISNPRAPSAQQPSTYSSNIKNQMPTNAPANGTSAVPKAQADPASKPAGSYTLAEVAAHSSASSCWSAINGNVYDLTSWINQHPGGPNAILTICGKDGSAAFDGQHGGQSRPANELNGFQIGILWSGSTSNQAPTGNVSSSAGAASSNIPSTVTRSNNDD